MNNSFYFILTKVGIAKLVNAQMTLSKVEYSYVAFGDGNGSYYDPSAEATNLRNQVYRAPISIVEHEKDENNNPTNRVRIESVIPASVGNFTIREIGLIDSQGDMVGIGKYPATYKPSTEQGAAKDLIVRIIVETTNAESITLKVDPSIAIASRQYVDQKIGSFIQILEKLEDGTIVLADLETNNKDLTGAINEVNAKVTQHLDESLAYKTIKLNKDSEGIFTTVETRRKTDHSLISKSVLSGGVSPKYTTRTVIYYETNGTTVKNTYTYALTYDADGVLVSEV